MPKKAPFTQSKCAFEVIFNAAPPSAAVAKQPPMTLSPTVKPVPVRTPNIRQKPSVTRLIALLLVSIASLTGARCFAQSSVDISLPELGDGSSGLISLQQEHRLGRIWLMAFRNQIDVQNDPLLQTYLEQFVYDLASYSELKDRRLEIILINNPTINAFAVPGGVIGVNTGLFHYAENESEFGAVLAHELAHLSQRHYARAVEAQKRAALPTMAGLLAGILLASTGGGDAGMATIAATQAANLQSQLRYSRLHEQEADRIGMQTLIAAHMDPNSMAQMFENMLQTQRYAGTRPPEFLLTHPVTESRINDARNRARQLPREVHTDSLDYQLMRIRAEVLQNNDKKTARDTIEAQTKASPSSSEANRYGLALAYIGTGQLDKAQQSLAPLVERRPNSIPYVIAQANIYLAAGKTKEGIKTLDNLLLLNPGNHPLTMALSHAYLATGQAPLAEKLLEEHSKRRPNDPSVWYLLAETYGLSGNILGVHQARAEYFVLNGVLDKAIQQLNYALPMVENNPATAAKIQGRIQQITDLRAQLDAMH